MDLRRKYVSMAGEEQDESAWFMPTALALCLFTFSLIFFWDTTPDSPVISGKPIPIKLDNMPSNAELERRRWPYRAESLESVQPDLGSAQAADEAETAAQAAQAAASDAADAAIAPPVPEPAPVRPAPPPDAPAMVGPQ